jgi:hypothetical protein
MTNESDRGSRIAVSPARRMVMELLHHARQVPSLPLSRVLDVSSTVAARRAHPTPPSWLAIFLKAYGLVALRHPELRRAYIPWPRPHFYQHPQSIALLPVEREWQGEAVVLPAKVRGPETQPLEEITAFLRYLQEAPVLEVSPFRQVLRLGRLPGLFRRFTLWQSLHLSGCKRAKRMGTFILSSLGQLGVEQHNPYTPLTTYATFGPISPTGAVTAKIIYDHRVMDGRTVARALVDLEAVLGNEIVNELSAGPQRRSA